MENNSQRKHQSINEEYKEQRVYSGADFYL